MYVVQVRDRRVLQNTEQVVMQHDLCMNALLISARCVNVSKAQPYHLIIYHQSLSWIFS